MIDPNQILVDEPRVFPPSGKWIVFVLSPPPGNGFMGVETGLTFDHYREAKAVAENLRAFFKLCAEPPKPLPGEVAP